MWYNPVVEWKKWNELARRIWEGASPDTPVNSYESEQAYMVQMAVPGVKAEAVDIDVKDGILSVKVDAAPAEPEGYKVLHREISHTRIAQQLRLPRNVNTEAIEASVVDGLLLIRIPKAEVPATRKITVKQ